MSMIDTRLRLGAFFVTVAMMVPVHSVSVAQSLELAILNEAELYSLEYGIGRDVAAQRLELQQRIGELEPRIAASAGRTFAGMWIEHSPSFKVVTSFTEPAAAQLAVDRLEGASDLLDLVEVRHVRHSLAELEADQAAASFVATQVGIAVNTDINVPRNRVEVLTTDSLGLEAALVSAGLELPGSVAIVEVDELAKPLIYGGWKIAECTTGFSVRSGNVYGILTAAHCGSNLTTAAGTLQVMGTGCASGLDVQWATGNTHFEPKIKDTHGGGWRWIRSIKGVGSQVIGEYVCKFGRNTGLTCGTIGSKNYYPGISCMHASGYVVVNQIGYMQGDSGGPVFSDFTAYGTVACATGPSSLCYAPIDFISALGVEVFLYTEQPPPGGGGPCLEPCWEK